MFEKRLFEFSLRVEEGVWVLAGISIIVGLKLKRTLLEKGLKGCPVSNKASFVQLSR